MSKPPALSLRHKLLLASQNLAPVAVKAGLILQLGSGTAAQLAPHMPPAQLRELVPELPRDFIAEVISQLEPQWILETYLAMSDELHLDVARHLCRKQLFETAAQYAECLPSSRLRALIFGLEPDDVLHIARFIGNFELIIDSLRSFSAQSLARLAEAAVRAQALDTALQVMSGLSLAKQADICSHLEELSRRRLLPRLITENPKLREHLSEALLSTLA